MCTCFLTGNHYTCYFPMVDVTWSGSSNCVLHLSILFYMYVCTVSVHASMFLHHSFIPFPSKTHISFFCCSDRSITIYDLRTSSPARKLIMRVCTHVTLTFQFVLSFFNIAFFGTWTLHRVNFFHLGMCAHVSECPVFYVKLITSYTRI